MTSERADLQMGFSAAPKEVVYLNPTFLKCASISFSLAGGGGNSYYNQL